MKNKIAIVFLMIIVTMVAGCSAPYITGENNDSGVKDGNSNNTGNKNESIESFCNSDADCKLLYGSCNCYAIEKNSSKTAYDIEGGVCITNNCPPYATAKCVENKCAVQGA
ncbi:MAG TPA: hypothetical protein VI968_03485 [archaeon]|nr:hypothetical protein [archaeon]